MRVEPSGSGARVAQGADRVDVALHDVAAEAVGEAHRAFEVDRVAGARARRATVRSRVSVTASAAQPSSCSSTTVRQQPLTAIDAPSSASSSTRRAAISMRAPPALGVTARTVPSSSTMPVNIMPLPTGGS